MEINFMLRELPLDSIDPFDALHFSDGNGGFRTTSDEDDKDHEEGVEWTRSLIREGKEIRPILVIPIKGGPYRYQRLDGFKRYFAHKREGKTTIRCVIIDQYIPGGQHGLTQTIDG